MNVCEEQGKHLRFITPKTQTEIIMVFNNEKTTQPVCVIVGAGAGNGMAFARTFSAKGFTVVLLARNKSALDKRIEQVPSLKCVFSYSCDVTKPEAVETVFAEIKQQHGTINTLIYNAGNAAFDNVTNASVNTLEKTWKTNVQGLLSCSQQVIPGMKGLQGKASIVVIGATASVKGSASFLSFASAKGGQRNMAESMARALAPEGIHVSYVVIDGVIDTPMTRGFLKDKADDFFLNADAIANTVSHLAAQDKSAWTFQVDIRPFSEQW